MIDGAVDGAVNSAVNSFDYMGWVVIPLLIFLARLADVTLATLRHILVYKGMRRVVPVFGFFEVLIWLVAITQVMQNLTNVACYLGWAFGFAAGSYLGIVIEEKLALGHQLVRIITNGKTPDLFNALTSNGYGVTISPARGSQGPVDIFFVAVERKHMRHLIACIKDCDPNLFFTIEDVRTVGSGIFGRSTLPTEGFLKKK